MYISQEDDVSVSLQNVEYLIRREQWLSGSDFYPDHVFQESDNGQLFTDFRLREGRIFRVNGRLVFESAHGTNPCVYGLEE